MLTRAKRGDDDASLTQRRHHLPHRAHADGAHFRVGIAKRVGQRLERSAHMLASQRSGRAAPNVTLPPGAASDDRESWNGSVP